MKARDTALASTDSKKVLMKRHAPEEAPIRDDPNFTHLHRACLLWVYYLRAESEVKKQAFLYEAAKHLMRVQPCGDEGELVYVQVWDAIRRREMASAHVETKVGYNYVQAKDDGSFSHAKVLTYKQGGEDDRIIR